MQTPSVSYSWFEHNMHSGYNTRVSAQANQLRTWSSHMGPPLTYVFVSRSPLAWLSDARVRKCRLFYYECSIDILSRKLVPAAHHRGKQNTSWLDVWKRQRPCIGERGGHLPSSSFSLDKIVPVIVPDDGVAVRRAIKDSSSLVMCCFEAFILGHFALKWKFNRHRMQTVGLTRMQTVGLRLSLSLEKLFGPNSSDRSWVSIWVPVPGRPSEFNFSDHFCHHNGRIKAFFLVWTQTLSLSPFSVIFCLGTWGSWFYQGSWFYLPICLVEFRCSWQRNPSSRQILNILCSIS